LLDLPCETRFTLKLPVRPMAGLCARRIAHEVAADRRSPACMFWQHILQVNRGLSPRPVVNRSRNSYGRLSTCRCTSYQDLKSLRVPSNLALGAGRGKCKDYPPGLKATPPCITAQLCTTVYRWPWSSHGHLLEAEPRPILFCGRERSFLVR
jgi:hypothetical protein